MHKLKPYIAIIPRASSDQFHKKLDNVSAESGIKAFTRISTIVPLREYLVYKLELSEEETCIMSLSCPGEYIDFSDVSHVVTHPGLLTELCNRYDIYLSNKEQILAKTSAI